MSCIRHLLLTIALITLAACSTGCITNDKTEDSQSLLEGHKINERLVEIAGQEPDVGTFITNNLDYYPEITVLDPDNITQLSKKYPVIYDNLPNKTLYKIDYRGDNGVLVIIDLENEEVLRYFRTAGVSLE